MSNELFIKLVGSAITVIAAVITSFVIPYIKSKLNAEALNKLDAYTKMAVRCAEQIFSTEEFAKKKEYVLACVTDYVNKNMYTTLTPNDIEILIESAVNEIKYSGDYNR